MKTNKFFKEWEQNSFQIRESNVKNELDKDIQTISSLIYCTEIDAFTKVTFPNLKYKVVQEHFKVAIIKDFNSADFVALKDERRQNIEFLLKKPIVIFSDTTYKNKAQCNDLNVKLLLLTEKYKKMIAGKLKYGFGVMHEDINENNARVILAKKAGSKNYTVPLEIEKITLNKSQDTAMVITASRFEGKLLRFVKQEAIWKVDDTIWRLISD